MSSLRQASSVRIAEALKDLLEDAAAPFWTESGETEWVYEGLLTFQRGTLPDFKKGSLNAPVVVVLPQGVSGRSSDRYQEQLGYQIGVALLRNVGEDVEGRQDVLDKLTAQVEQLQDFICWNTQQRLTLPAVMDGLTEIQPAHYARLILPFENEPIFDANMLREESVFLSVTNFTYFFSRQRG